jgi:hypothetical protein
LESLNRGCIGLLQNVKHTYASHGLLGQGALHSLARSITAEVGPFAQMDWGLIHWASQMACFEIVVRLRKPVGWAPGGQECLCYWAN